MHNTNSSLSKSSGNVIGTPASVSSSSDSKGADLMAELWQEYKSLTEALREQGHRQDIVLRMRLSVVAMDLGLCHVSVP